MGLRSIVMSLDVVEDRLLQLSHALEPAASQALLRQIPKPAFDQVQPGAAGRREVHVKPRVTREPAPDLGMLVGRVVVGDQVQLSFRIGCGVDVF